MLPYKNQGTKENNIVIVGLGGAGAHILERFSGSSAENVRLCIMSPDERLGRESGNVEFLQLGAGLNHGLGSGGDPEVGRMALEESREQIQELLSGARLLVMVVGLGGGTGSGVAPLLAEMAVQAGIFLVSVVVMPFAIEGKRRREQADRALEAVSAQSDIVCCFENDYMEELFAGKNTLQTVYEAANSLLAQLTATVPMMANSPGLINIGLDELIATLRNNDSRCIIGSGSGYGPRRAEDAARAALESPLPAYHGSLRFAHSMIVHIAGGASMSLAEVQTIMDTIRKELPQSDDDLQIFFGAAVKKHLGEEIRVNLIAGIDAVEFCAAVQADKEADKQAAEAAPEPEEEPEIPEEEEETPPEEEEAPESEDIFGPEETPEENLSPLPEPEPETRWEPEPEPDRPAPQMTQQSLFSLDNEPASAPDDLPEKYAPLSDDEQGGSRRNRTNLDTPPSMRKHYNDLRDMFPE